MAPFWSTTPDQIQGIPIKEVQIILQSCPNVLFDPFVEESHLPSEQIGHSWFIFLLWFKHYQPERKHNF